MTPPGLRSWNCRASTVRLNVPTPAVLPERFSQHPHLRHPAPASPFLPAALPFHSGRLGRTAHGGLIPKAACAWDGSAARLSDPRTFPPPPRTPASEPDSPSDTPRLAAIRIFGGAGMGNLAVKSSPLGQLLQTANSFGGCVQHPTQSMGAPACVFTAPNPYSYKCDFGLPLNNASYPASADCTFAIGCVSSCNPMKLLGNAGSWTPDSFGGNKVGRRAARSAMSSGSLTLPIADLLGAGQLRHRRPLLGQGSEPDHHGEHRRRLLHRRGAAAHLGGPQPEAEHHLRAGFLGLPAAPRPHRLQQCANSVRRGAHPCNAEQGLHLF